MKKMSLLFVYCILLISLMVRCEKQTEKDMQSLPEVTTGIISSITVASFAYEAIVTSDGESPVIARGICFNTTGEPTINDSKVSSGSGVGEFIGEVFELNPGQVYYARAYATNSVGTSYGNTKKVTLQKEETLRGAEQAYPGIKGKETTVSYMGQLIECIEINGLLFYHGDILIDPQGTKAIGENNKFRRWPYNTVYYYIDPGFPKKERISESFKLFDKTHIQFKERTDEPNYVLFKYIPGAGSYSYVGMLGKGEQEIVIDNWAEVGTVAHEIAHALGLLHEQTKPNRDEYIIIHFENILNDYKRNFTKFIVDSEYTEGFDYNSLMCYHSFAFTKYPNDPNKPTMTKPDGFTTFFPQRDYFTVNDITIINKLYPPIPDLELNKKEIHFDEGNETQLIISKGSGNYAVESNPEDIVSATTNESVITLKALTAGNTILTITDKITGKEISISITVNQKTVSVTGITVSPSSKTLIEGESFTLTATVHPSNADNKTVNWNSSNPTIAYVDTNGKITAKKAGITSITVVTQDGQKTATCTITVLSTEVQLPVLSVSSGSLEFGEVAVGNSDTQILTISNVGNTSMTLSLSTPTNTAYTIIDHPNSLAPNETTRISVRFHPTVEGNYSASFSITSNGGNKTISLNGISYKQTPILNVSHKYIDLGYVLLNTEVTYKINIYNTGKSSLSINNIFISGRPLFENGYVPNIAVGSSMEFTLPFVFTLLGDITNMVTIYSNAGNINIPVYAKVVSPSIHISPVDIDFGKILFGEKYGIIVRISNTGFIPLIIGDIEIINRLSNYAPPFYCTTMDGNNWRGNSTILAGDYLDIIVWFNPYAAWFSPETITQFEAFISISSNSGNRNINLTGLGVGSKPCFSGSNPPVGYYPQSCDPNNDVTGTVYNPQTGIIVAGIAAINCAESTITFEFKRCDNRPFLHNGYAYVVSAFGYAYDVNPLTFYQGTSRQQTTIRDTQMTGTKTYYIQTYQDPKIYPEVGSGWAVSNRITVTY